MTFGGTVYGRRVRIGGEWFDSITEEAVADRVITALAEGRGGRIVTPNVDILRLAGGTSRMAAEVRAFLADATLVVADGMPLVWASKLAGTPLPERVTGSGLIWTLSAALGRALGRPSWAPAPGFALKIVLGEMADMLLGGQKAVPAKLLAAGYRFKYPGADEALARIYG